MQQKQTPIGIETSTRRADSGHLYMALVLGRARQHQGAELVATTVNALVHHEPAVAGDEAVAHVAAVVRGDVGSESELWLEAQIERISQELDH
jgi:hypothetical protein